APARCHLRGMQFRKPLFRPVPTEARPWPRLDVRDVPHTSRHRNVPHSVLHIQRFEVLDQSPADMVPPAIRWAHQLRMVPIPPTADTTYRISGGRRRRQLGCLSIENARAIRCDVPGGRAGLSFLQRTHPAPCKEPPESERQSLKFLQPPEI